jgi:hypothetical protein
MINDAGKHEVKNRTAVAATKPVTRASNGQVGVSGIACRALVRPGNASCVGPAGSRAVRKPQPVLNRMSLTGIVLDKDIKALNRTADVETEN